MITENLSTLKIHKLSQEQFEREREAGRLDSSALYLTPDENSSTIIDVTKLPTENINEGAIYRLVTGHYVYDGTTWDNFFVVHCVDSLPEIGLPATNADITKGNIYYSVADNKAYGYVDDMLSVGFGVPVGWYDDTTLLGALGYNAGGIITDIGDAEFNDYCYILIDYNFYIYKNGWTKLIYAEEKPPKFDLTWDGEIGDRFVLDMSMLGYDAGTYFVKVSDKVLGIDDVIGGTYEYYWNSDSHSYIDEICDYHIDNESFPGAFSINEWAIVVYDNEMLTNTLELPSGYITNGIYYLLSIDTNRLIRLTSSKRITKMIDGKYVNIHEDNSIFKTVAFTGNYNDLSNTPTIYNDVIRYTTTQSLASNYKQIARNNIDVYSKSEVNTKIANAGTSVDLSEYAKTSEVQTMIFNAIGSAIGGSY